MEDSNALADWSNGLAGRHLPRWNELPDIELYLDQVLSLLDKYLGPYIPQGKGHVVTSSMINNYVKLRIVPPPVKKRYGRTHLAYLIVIGLLKQVMAIQDVKLLLESQFAGLPEAGAAQAFDRFCVLQERAFTDAAAKALRPAGVAERAALAMEMAVMAGANKALAERLVAAAPPAAERAAAAAH